MSAGHWKRTASVPVNANHGTSELEESLTSIGFISEEQLADRGGAAPAAEPPIAPAPPGGATLIGRRIGPYQIAEPLGTGSGVYRARDAKHRRDAAIRILPRAAYVGGDRLDRLDVESRALAALEHPHIASIHAVVSHDDGACAVLADFVDGTTLAKRLTGGTRVPVQEAMDIARQVASALEAAHRRNVVHRDLRPAKVKVTSTGTVKVLDFGLAAILAGPLALRSTASGYLAPEQVDGADADQRSDTWRLALLLYHMITGRQPFEDGRRPTPAAITAALAELPKQVQADLTPFLARALAIDPADRYQAVTDEIADLERVREKLGSARTTSSMRAAQTPVAPAAPPAPESIPESAAAQASEAGATSGEPEPLPSLEASALDLSAADSLIDIRTRQRALRDYRARAVKIEGVEEAVARKVLADYDARHEDLERKAAPFIRRVRDEHDRVRQVVDRIMRADEDARLLKAEADLRHAVGEIDETELAERVAGPNEIRASCAQQLAALDAIKSRFVEALESTDEAGAVLPHESSRRGSVAAS